MTARIHDEKTLLDAALLSDADKTLMLMTLGERVRGLRARRGMTRKSLAATADVSERHLANLESGSGNASVVVLSQIAAALQSPVAELLGDATTASPEWLLIRQQLAGLDDDTLRQVRRAISQALGQGGPKQRQRIALIGLRGAGKTTLGKRLAEALSCPFVELSREIERLAATSVAEIQALYGVTAYRRYERRALDACFKDHSQVVIATPGGMVSDLATFNVLLEQCTTVWLQAAPEDHMHRVASQGDMRPMRAASSEAMADLKGILAGRSALYAKADIHINTSLQSLEQTFELLHGAVKKVLTKR